MLFEQMLELCRHKNYEVDIKFQQRFTYVKVTDTEHDSLFADFRVSSDLLTQGIATEALARIAMYEHDAMEYNPDALLSADTLAKLKSYSTTQPEDVMGIVDPTELLTTDEVSEARMSYYRVNIDKTFSRHMYGVDDVHIYVKVDEYREIVKAVYMSEKTPICGYCGVLVDVCECGTKYYMGIQAELDKSEWVKLDDVDYVPESLLAPYCHLFQKLPSEIEHDAQNGGA